MLLIQVPSVATCKELGTNTMTSLGIMSLQWFNTCGNMTLVQLQNLLKYVNAHGLLKVMDNFSISHAGCSIIPACSPGHAMSKTMKACEKWRVEDG